MKNAPKNNLAEDLVDAVMDHIERWMPDYAWQEEAEEKWNFRWRMKSVIKETLDNHV